MKTCKDCIHFSACEDWARNWGIECLNFPWQCSDDDNLCENYDPQTPFKQGQMSFKEQMTEKANKYDANKTADEVREHINAIKNKIDMFYYKRSLTVSLIDAHSTMAIGGGNSNRYELFVPDWIKPLEYRQLLVDALSQLGFAGIDLEFVSVPGRIFDKYDIILKW